MLQIIHQALPAPSVPGNEVPLLVDRMTLAKRRWQAAATDGMSFGFDLEAPLNHRDVFFETATTQYFIAQKPEPVLEISLTGIQSATHLAWSLGNLHFAIQAAGKTLRVGDDPAIRALLERNHISFTARTAVFHPFQASPSMDTPIDWLPSLLQNSDSLFPTGAYAHSSGLEEVVRLGLVTDEAGLQTFLHDQAIPALEHLELPFLRYAFVAGQGADLGLLSELSEEISAWKLSREARAGSLQMGQGRLQAARKVFPHPLLESLAAASMPKHLIIVYGWQMAVTDVPLQAALAGYFYQSLAGTCSAALKLIRIGQEGVQRVLQHSLAKASASIASSLQVERFDAGWFSPVLEIAAMRHERAQERLFIS